MDHIPAVKVNFIIKHQNHFLFYVLFCFSSSVSFHFIFPGRCLPSLIATKLSSNVVKTDTVENNQLHQDIAIQKIWAQSY